MNDVKELFEAVLDAPAPPLASSATVIGAARRSQRHHRTTWTLAAVALVAVGATALVRLAPTTAPPTQAAGLPTQTAVGPPSTNRPDPATLAILDKQQAALAAALPSTAAVVRGFVGESSNGTDWVIGTFADVKVGNEVGQVYAYLLASTSPAPTGDLCALPWTSQLFIDIPLTCDTVQSGGLNLRVGTLSTGLPSDLTLTAATRYAARYGDGWLLVVAEQPFNNDNHDHPQPTLTTPIFTLQQLADIAADPALAG